MISHNHRQPNVQQTHTTAKPFAWTYTGDPLKFDHTRGTNARQH